MAHLCKNIIVSCMDFRLWPEMFIWMKKQGFLGDCDLVAMAGASKGIVDGDESGEALLKQIDTSVSLHKIQRVVLLHHSNCGAYARSYQFASAEEEKQKQLADMKKSQTRIKEKYPNVEVKLVWAGLKDDDGRAIDFTQV